MSCRNWSGILRQAIQPVAISFENASDLPFPMDGRYFNFQSILLNLQGNGQFIHHVPQVFAKNIFYKFWENSKNSPVFIMNIPDLKIGFDAVRDRVLKILERLFCEISNMRRVPKGPAGGKVGDCNINPGARFAHLVNFLHKDNQTAYMFEKVAGMQSIDRIGFKRQGLLEITNDVYPGVGHAVYSDGSGNFFASATQINDHFLHESSFLMSNTFSLENRE